MTGTLSDNLSSVHNWLGICYIPLTHMLQQSKHCRLACDHVHMYTCHKHAQKINIMDPAEFLLSGTQPDPRPTLLMTSPGVQPV